VPHGPGTMGAWYRSRLPAKADDLSFHGKVRSRVFHFLRIGESHVNCAVQSTNAQKLLRLAEEYQEKVDKPTASPKAPCELSERSWSGRGQPSIPYTVIGYSMRPHGRRHGA
jgi:hypothetical protein